MGNLAEIQSKIDELKKTMISDKEEEMKKHTANAGRSCGAGKKEQYAAMKVRIQYLMKGKISNSPEMLLSAKKLRGTF